MIIEVVDYVIIVAVFAALGDGVNKRADVFWFFEESLGFIGEIISPEGVEHRFEL